MLYAWREVDGDDSWAAIAGLPGKPLWSRYVRSFDRGLLIVIGEGEHGETDAEVLISLVGYVTYAT